MRSKIFQHVMFITALASIGAGTAIAGNRIQFGDISQIVCDGKIGDRAVTETIDYGLTAQTQTITESWNEPINGVTTQCSRIYAFQGSDFPGFDNTLSTRVFAAYHSDGLGNCTVADPEMSSNAIQVTVEINAKRDPRDKFSPKTFLRLPTKPDANPAMPIKHVKCYLVLRQGPGAPF